MAKKRKYNSMRDGGYKFDGQGEHSYDRATGHIPRGGYKETFEERMDLNRKMRVMHTNNGDVGVIREDFNRPCGLPYGALSRDVGNADYMPTDGYRVGDLFYGVEKSMKNDTMAIRKQLKATNW